VKEFYKPTPDCTKLGHCDMHIWKPDVYRKKLCDFWTHVFGLKVEHCGIDDLPKYDEQEGSKVKKDRRMTSAGRTSKSQEQVIV
jgi:hypothetical protein